MRRAEQAQALIYLALVLPVLLAIAGLAQRCVRDRARLVGKPGRVHERDECDGYFGLG